MLTRSALRSLPDSVLHAEHTVTAAPVLYAAGWTSGQIAAQLAARRWRRVGRAIVQHDGHLTREETIRVCVLNAGRRVVTTAFTAAETLGLTGWDRPSVHLLVPAGTRARRVPVGSIRVHYAGNWSAVETLTGRPIHSLPPALIRAASSFESPRPACALLAAGVQQRLIRASDLRDALSTAPRTRHRKILALALADIEQGSEALSELDFAALCRRHGLPLPVRQAVRADRQGRKRYLDAEWVRADGVRVVVEVDGALHLAVRQWWSDQSRQNELVIGGDMVLRYPSVVVRTDEAAVADQLRRVLLG